MKPPPTAGLRRQYADRLGSTAGSLSDLLNAGVPSTQVAEWAGHSVAVLHQIYAKCIVGQEDAARKRITAALAVGTDG